MRLKVRCAVCGRFIFLQESTPSCTASIRKHPVQFMDGTVQFPGIRFTLYFCPTAHSEEKQEKALDVVEAGILEALRWHRVGPQLRNLEPVVE